MRGVRRACVPLTAAFADAFEVVDELVLDDVARLEAEELGSSTLAAALTVSFLTRADLLRMARRAAGRGQSGIGGQRMGAMLSAQWTRVLLAISGRNRWATVTSFNRPQAQQCCDAST